MSWRVWYLEGESYEVYVGDPCEGVSFLFWRVRQVGLLLRFWSAVLTLVSSRKPFTPLGHWSVSSQIDIQSFIQTIMHAPTSPASANKFTPKAVPQLRRTATMSTNRFLPLLASNSLHVPAPGHAEQHPLSEPVRVCAC